MGKTTTYNKYFKPAGYVYVDQKAFKTRSSCMKATEDAIKAGKSVVVGKCYCSSLPSLGTEMAFPDNTNHDAATRDDYLQIGASLKAPVR